MVKLHFLENRTNTGYVTWGVPWKKGEVNKENGFELKNEKGEKIAVQTKVNAYWPDGSYKWTAHTANCAENCEYTLEAVDKAKESEIEGIVVTEDEYCFYVNAGRTEAIFDKKGKNIIRNLVIDGRQVVTKGELKCIIEERQQKEDILVRREISCASEISNVSIEDTGALKTVIKIEGIHKNKSISRENLPFILRFIIHNEENYVQIMHTFICDIEPAKDFIKGIGIEFECPIEGEMYNRHFKTRGDYGYFHEAMQLMSSWRPRIDESIYKSQLDGNLLNFSKEKDALIFKAIEGMVTWDSYKLYQDSPNHFLVKKSTGKENCAYIDAIHGEYSNGLVYVAGEKGGIALGMKDFWQKYPSSMWVEGISKKTTKITAWIWSPESEALDMRHYDDKGHAMTCYEGFDEVRSTPYGVANTNELTIWGLADGIASDEMLDRCAYQLQNPAVIVATPEYYHQTKAFGYWGMEKRDTAAEKWLEEQLDLSIEFYKNEIKQRNWYGLFNYGDVMHTYDPYRHSWRYDMGGYAWQNTELVPTLWLWYAFLRSGREDIFTLAQNMSRHCSDVDIYHIGQYKGIGSRHNVLHWGDSCKEARIGMAGHHRFTYYLTGDYRIGDVLEDVKDGDFALLNIDPLRTMYNREEMVYPTHARSGPDWSSFCSNWLTAWERHQDNHYKEKLLTGIEDIKKSPLKLVSGSDYEYNPATGHLRYIGECKTGSHLALCMGSIQTWLELIESLEDNEWEEMLADYGEFFHLPMEEKIERSGGICATKGWSYPYMSAGLGAYAAKYKNDSKLAEKMWDILFNDLGSLKGFETVDVENYFNNKSLKEIPWISTNFTAQWCLNTIMALEFIREYLPKEGR